jgi:hypothetical protein
VEKGKGGGGMGRRKKERKSVWLRNTGPQVIIFNRKNFYQFIRSGHKICRLGCRLRVSNNINKSTLLWFLLQIYQLQMFGHPIRQELKPASWLFAYVLCNCLKGGRWGRGGTYS